MGGENMNELYQRLGVLPTATGEEIKKAYRKLAKQLHPDLHLDDPRAEDKFREISGAYEILGDKNKRKEYDRTQQSTSQHCTEKQTKKAEYRSFTSQSRTVDFSQMQRDFSQFFGFDPKTGQITDESKLSGKRRENPLDASDIFERFMGFK